LIFPIGARFGLCKHVIIFLFYGGLSSAAERLPVEEDVTGSIPVGHPNTIG
jgi:hypothetical protein